MSKLISTTQNAAKIIEKIISMIPKGSDYLKLDNSGGIFMPLVVEKIGDCLFSFCHYYEQNGDLMRDPEIVFYRKEAIVDYPTYFYYYPANYTQDNLGVYDEIIKFDETGKPFKFNPKMQKSCVSFCSIWFLNIKHQQNL